MPDISKEQEIREQEQRIAIMAAIVRATEESLWTLRIKLYQAGERLAFLKYGVQTGSIVRDSNGRRFRVTRMQTYSDGTWPILYATPAKKDGTFSACERYIGFLMDFTVESAEVAQDE